MPQYGGSCRHHGYTSVCNSVPIPQTGDVCYDGHHFECFSGNFHRNESGMPGGFLNGSAAGSFFFIGSFGKFKTGKNFIIGFGVFINQGDEFFWNRVVIVCACCITSSLASYPFLPMVSLVTIVQRKPMLHLKRQYCHRRVPDHCRLPYLRNLLRLNLLTWYFMILVIN